MHWRMQWGEGHVVWPLPLKTELNAKSTCIILVKRANVPM